MTRTCGLLLAAFCVALLPPAAMAQKKGGEVVVGMYIGANSIDPHFSASYPTRTMLFPIYETLYTVDDHGSPIPMLADDLAISPDGTRYDFKLRHGVKFHNGKEMTSADVVASLRRYMKYSPDKINFAQVTAIDAPDPYEVVIQLSQATPVFLDRLASPTSPTSIIPAEQAERELNKTDNIGTGPFKFVDWIPDNHMTLARFDDYVPNTKFAGPDGFGGKKTVWFDRVQLRFLTESGGRVAALESGQVHFIEEIPQLTVKRLQGNPKLVIVAMPTFQMPVLYLNHSLPPTNNLGVRRAIQAALDADEIMDAASGGVYKLNHAWVFDGNAFYNDGGKSLYNINNPEKAKQILKESGYKGEPIIFNVATVPLMSRGGVVAAEELKAIGLNIQARSMDWPTMATMANGNEGWNMATSSFGSQPFVGAWSYKRLFSGEYNLAREFNDKTMDQLWAKFDGSTDVAQRKAVWQDIQQRSYDEVYVVKLGDMGLTYGYTAQLKGFKPFVGGIRMWDAWLE